MDVRELNANELVALMERSVLSPAMRDDWNLVKAELSPDTKAIKLDGPLPSLQLGNIFNKRASVRSMSGLPSQSMRQAAEAFVEANEGITIWSIKVPGYLGRLYTGHESGGAIAFFRLEDPDDEWGPQKSG